MFIQSLKMHRPQAITTLTQIHGWENILNAALRAADAAIEATDVVMSGIKKHEFCNVRPPGHQAEHDPGKGFCFFNNVAFGALHAIKHHGFSSVGIVEF